MSRNSILRIADKAIMRSATATQFYKVSHSDDNIYRQGGIVYQQPVDLCAIHSRIPDTNIESRVGHTHENSMMLTFSILYLRKTFPSAVEGQWVIENDVFHISGVQYKVSSVTREGYIAGGANSHVVTLLMFPDPIKLVP